MKLSKAKARELGIDVPATSKYRAKPTTIDGIRFHSKREAKRYGELKLLEQAGKISGLMLQPKYTLRCQDRDGVSVEVCSYLADFSYMEDGKEVVEDCKGMRTAVYRIKKKWCEAQFGITIRET